LQSGASASGQAWKSASNDAIFVSPPHGWINPMRTTLEIDDELLAKAQEYTGLQEKSAIVRAALKALVEREAARRLARLGGTEPQLRPAPRRRSR
jgi:Arc/MetJ family transcription regulator